MSLQQQPPKRQPSSPTCQACGTPSRNGRNVPGLGWCGPTCYEKVAAFTAVLEQNGLADLFGSRYAFEPVPDEDAHGVSSWVFPAHVEAMRWRAEKLGLKFEWSWPHRKGPAECWVLLPRSFKLRRRLLTRLERSQAVTA